jgi:hypothetical protein
MIIMYHQRSVYIQYYVIRVLDYLSLQSTCFQANGVLNSVSVLRRRDFIHSSSLELAGVTACTKRALYSTYTGLDTRISHLCIERLLARDVVAIKQLLYLICRDCRRVPRATGRDFLLFLFA